MATERVCEYPGCTEVYVPVKSHQRFHDSRCRKRAYARTEKGRATNLRYRQSEKGRALVKRDNDTGGVIRRRRYRLRQMRARLEDELAGLTKEREQCQTYLGSLTQTK